MVGTFRLFKDFFYFSYFYREYLKQSVARDLRKKYKRSSLGYLWSMLNPLFMMIILTVVFSEIMRAQGIKNYAVFLFCGMIPWAYFDSTCQAALGTIRANARIIDQIPVPKFIFPLTASLYNVVNLFLSLLTLFIVMLATGMTIPLTASFFLVILIPLFLFSMGISLLLAAANVFYEDTTHLTSVILKALYFLCPILYERSMLPQKLIPLIVLNPLFGIIEATRSVFYYGTVPSFETFAINLLASVFTLGLGLWVFKKVDDKFLYFI